MSAELAPAVAPGGALTLIQQAMASGLSPEHLEKLLAVKKDWEADEARKLFYSAVSEFQRRCPIIEKGDLAHDKQYARIDRIWRTIRPLLADLKLSVTWQVCEIKDSMCHVEGMLAHEDGHSMRLVRDIPLPEIIRGQNKAQQAGSASSYAQRYALCGALGIVTGEDDDANAAGTQFVTYQQAEELDQLIQACRGINGFDEAKFWTWAEAKVAGEIPADKYAMAKRTLEAKLKGGTK